MTEAVVLSSGFNLVRRDIIDSTNEGLKRLEKEGALSGTVLWSTSQTHGKGRQGNHWVSPPGNLYASLLLRMRCDIHIVSQLSFITAIAVKDALPLDIKLKWPNDIWYDGKKLGGILLESSVGQDGATDWVIIGVGINVANHPRDVDNPASYLNAHGVTLSIEEVLQAFLSKFVFWYDKWTQEGFDPIRENWLEAAAFLGQEIEVNVSKSPMVGTFKDINQQGELVLRLPDSTEKLISAGEVFLNQRL